MVVDAHEHCPYRFANQQVTTVRRAFHGFTVGDRGKLRPETWDAWRAADT